MTRDGCALVSSAQYNAMCPAQLRSMLGHRSRWRNDSLGNLRLTLRCCHLAKLPQEEKVSSPRHSEADFCLVCYRKGEVQRFFFFGQRNSQLILNSTGLDVIFREEESEGRSNPSYTGAISVQEKLKDRYCGLRADDESD